MEFFTDYPVVGNPDGKRVPVQLLAYDRNKYVTVSYNGHTDKVKSGYITDAEGKPTPGYKNTLYELPYEVGGPAVPRREAVAALKKLYRRGMSYIVDFTPAHADNFGYDGEGRKVRKIVEVSSMAETLALTERLLANKWVPGAQLWIARITRSRGRMYHASVLSITPEEGLCDEGRPGRQPEFRNLTYAQYKRIGLAYERAKAKLAKAAAA